MFTALARLAQETENAGYDALFVPDHLSQNAVGGGADAPMMEAYTLLGALATVTHRLRLGAFVTPTSFRHPALLAKSVTTLDVVSGGRAILGVGAGWDIEEHQRYGIEFPAAARDRISRLEDAVTIGRSMFDQPRSSIAGRHTTLDNAVNSPAPLQPHIPILIGGGGEKLTLPLVARHADIANISAHDTHAVRRKRAILERECAAIGRDITTLTVTAFLVPDNAAHVAAVAHELASLGIDGLVIALTTGDANDINAYAEAIVASGLTG
jgi:F420-dependent oxidoreductase-like protein